MQSSPLAHISTLATSRYFGPGLFFLSELLFALSFSLVKYISHEVPIPLLMLFRVTPALFLIPLFLNKTLRFDFHAPKLMISRSIVGLISIICLTFSLKWGDYGKVNVLYSLGTVWAFIASMVFLKEKPHRLTMAAIPLSLIGLLCIFKPSGSVNLADFVSLLGSFLTAYVYVSIRTLRKNHNAMSIVFCFFMTSFVVLLVPAMLTFKCPSWHALLICGVVALSGFSAQILMTLGYKYTPVSVSSSIKLTGILLSVCIGIFFFKDPLDWLSGLGLVFVTSAIYLVTRYQ